MTDPLIVAVDPGPELLHNVDEALRDRYARSYRIVSLSSAAEALTVLEDSAAAGEDVALVLAGLAGRIGTELLGQVRRLHPHARRALLIAWGGWGNRAVGEAIYDAIAHGRMDHYLVRPSTSPDERFHHAVSSFLLDWAEARRGSPHAVHVVGESWSGRAYELRDVLGRCALPHTFSLADSDEGRAVLDGLGDPPALPLLLFPDGTVLSDPTDADIAEASGTTVDPDGKEYDLVIVGAGPAGLSAAVYGASEGFSTLVVDQGGLGGQATSSSLIRNYLGFPRGVGGVGLARQAHEQAWIFGASFGFMQRVSQLRREQDMIAVGLDSGGRVAARAVILATGARYRRLGVAVLEALNGAGVFYGPAASEAPAMAGREVYVVGGANAAGQAALHLARYARRVTLLVRAASLDVGMSHYLVRQVAATPNVHVRLNTEIVDGGGDGWLEHLVLRSGGQMEKVRADGVFLLIGARPHTDWIPPEVERDADGFVITGADLPSHRVSALGRAPFWLETSMRGVLAIGDVRHGSVKRVAAAVGEGSVAIQVLHHLFETDQLAAARV